VPTKVQASVSVNPLGDFKEVSRTLLAYSQQSSILGTGYTEYKKQDYVIGASKEINKSYSTGKQYGMDVVLNILAVTDTNDRSYEDGEELPTDYIPITTDTTVYTHSKFMPITEIKSDKNPKGLVVRDDSNADKIKSTKILKAMNLKLSTATNGILNTEDIPPVGGNGWGRYAKAYRQDPTIASSESGYRADLVKGKEEKEKQFKDVTDVAIGYFGLFNKDMRVAPSALYETYLEILPKTILGKIPEGSIRKFRLSNKLYDATYSMNGYIHRTMEGKIEGNTTGRAGYSKVDVLLEEDTPLQLSLGNIISSDYHGEEATPYFDRTYLDPISGESEGIKFERMKKVYVSIKVQDTPHSYKELILVDLFQETVIEGKNKTRIGNSGKQTSAESQNGMTWVEAYIAESFIPLTKTAMLKVKLFDRRRLLAETKCHFIQAINITEIKWYQTSIFKIILVIIAVVITIYTAGAGASVSAILLDLAVNAAIAFGINYVIDLLVEKGIISAEVGLVLKIVVSIYISGNGSFNVDLSLLDTASLLVEATGT
jgi:hypothetical protein